MAAAGKEEEDQLLRRAERAFDFVDGDGDGVLTRRELLSRAQTSFDTDGTVAELLAVPQNANLFDLFAQLDANSDGEVSKQEFVEFVRVLASKAQREKNRPRAQTKQISRKIKGNEAWDLIDEDDDGNLSKDEVCTALQKSLDTDGHLVNLLGLSPNVDLDLIWEAMDFNGDGDVSKGEFRDFFVVNASKAGGYVKRDRFKTGRLGSRSPPKQDARGGARGRGKPCTPPQKQKESVEPEPEPEVDAAPRVVAARYWRRRREGGAQEEAIFERAGSKRGARGSVVGEGSRRGGGGAASGGSAARVRAGRGAVGRRAQCAAGPGATRGGGGGGGGRRVLTGPLNAPPITARNDKTVI